MGAISDRVLEELISVNEIFHRVSSQWYEPAMIEFRGIYKKDI